MRVLSLFDGMSCGQIALRQLGIIPEVYYASEIDKHAIKQTQLNFPDTIQLGDVTKWKEWDIDWKSIDLVLAGSPCQGFSFAGKQLAFDDPRSKLFFVFIDILNHIKSVNPDVLFLLENVKMKKSHMKIISEYCGVFPVNINSNLVSAQNRDRWYWTNIRTKQVGLFGEVYTDIPQPEDKGIFLRDILEGDVNEKYHVSQSVLDRMSNSHKCFSPKVNPNKICVAMRGREDGKQHLESQNTGKTNCLTSVQKDNLIIQRPRGNNQGNVFEGKTPTLSTCAWEQNNLVVSGTFRTFKDGGFREIKSGKGACVTARARNDGSGQGGCIINGCIRRLTPIECSRLQTVPSWYRWKCSDTQIYKMLGNGWTVDVIVHILSYMKEKLNINVA